jgi:DNA-binding NarL/FixJ family response regulator
MAMQQRIKIVLADDHGLVRKGIREYLETDARMLIVGEATDGEQALVLIRELQPDVAVLDVQMPRKNGIDVARQLRAEKLHCGILVVSAYDDDPYVMSALRAGANGYVLKTAAPAELVHAVDEVIAGRLVLDDDLTHAVARHAAETALIDNSNARAEVSSREIEVLRLIARGHTNKAIAAQLDISDRTVQGHIANIFDKLGVHSRTEAVMIGIRLGVISQE